MSQIRSVYLDHAATTPMHPHAIEAMTAALATVGNPPRCTAGRGPPSAGGGARNLAARLGARPSEIVVTAGGTDSDNLALKGHLLGPPRRRP